MGCGASAQHTEQTAKEATPLKAEEETAKEATRFKADEGCQESRQKQARSYSPISDAVSAAGQWWSAPARSALHQRSRDQSIEQLERHFASQLPLSGRPTTQVLTGFDTETHEGAVECAIDLHSTCGTLVLGSFAADGWRSVWIQSLVSYLAMHVPCCELIHLYAIAGGASTQAETNFIRELLPRIGGVLTSSKEVMSTKRFVQS